MVTVITTLRSSQCQKRLFLMIPDGPIWGWLSTFCTSSSVIADAGCSCALQCPFYAISREKVSVLQVFTYPWNIIRKIHENFLTINSFGIFEFFSSGSFSSKSKFESNLRTKQWILFFRFAGQKFAMLELKSTISRVLRSFKVIESDSKDDLHFTLDIVLKSVNGLKVKLQMR